MLTVGAPIPPHGMTMGVIRQFIHAPTRAGRAGKSSVDGRAWSRAR